MGLVTADGACLSTFSAPWPPPASLEGVKSRNRVVYEIDSADIRVGDSISQVTGVRLCLESRVTAVGDAGRAVVAVLLGEAKLAAGRAKQHDKLVVAHLGPHLSDDGAASTEDFILLMEAALQKRRAHVVILDQASSTGNDAWADAYAKVLRSSELRAFRGAVIAAVDANSEDDVVRQVFPEHWVGDCGWVWQERWNTASLRIIEDALCAEKAVPPSIEEVLIDASMLSQLAFAEDSVEVSQRNGWNFTVLVSEDEGITSLRAFMAWEMGHGELKIGRLLVPREYRGEGHGQYLMQWILLKAARMPRTECAWISLSSLSSAVTFYEKYGFCDMTCEDVDDPAVFQIRMELRNRSVVPDEDSLQLESE